MTGRISHMNRGRRRKVRKRKSPAGSRKTGLLAAIGIIFAAVLLGFLTARFVIGPIIGYNTDISPVTLKNSDDPTPSEDKQDSSRKEEDSSTSSAQTASNAEENSYALQFGAFSDREAAEKLRQELKSKGVETQIEEQDGIFKVISAVIKTKEAALKALDQSKEKEITDVFITSF